MFPCLDHGIEVHGTEVGRCGHDNEFRIRSGGLFIGVKSPMAAGGIDTGFFSRLLGAILKDIAQGHNLDIMAENLRGILKIPQRGETALAAADDRDFEGFTALGRLCFGGEDSESSNARGGECRVAKEFSAADRCDFRRCFVVHKVV